MSDHSKENTPAIESIETADGTRWRWRHPLIRGGKWSREYTSRNAAASGMGVTFHHLRKGRAADGQMCVEIDGARVHMDPNANAEDIAAIRAIIAAATRRLEEKGVSKP